MGGLPRLTEIRSVSKIGLSAITIVFEDGVNDYFARQLVSERLQGARDKFACRRRSRTGSDHDRSRRNLSIHARQQETAEIRRDRAAHDSGLHRAPDPAHGAGSHGCEFIRRFREAISGDRQTRPAHVVTHHLAAGVRGAGKEQRQRERQLHRAQIGTIRRARARFGEEHRGYREHHRRDARTHADLRARCRRT